MSTRRAERGEPTSFSDYRSSPEYAELRGVDGFAATAKAGTVAEADKRRLVFPVTLIATPQFTRRLAQVEKQTIWQSTQFRRRIKDFERLPVRVSVLSMRIGSRCSVRYAPNRTNLRTQRPLIASKV